MSQNTYKKSISIGIEVIIVLAIAVLFVIIMLLLVLPQFYSANQSILDTGDKIVDMFTPKK